MRARRSAGDPVAHLPAGPDQRPGPGPGPGRGPRQFRRHRGGRVDPRAFAARNGRDRALADRRGAGGPGAGRRGGMAHRGGGSLSIDHPDRIRISASGDAVLAFPGTLADSDAQSDVRGLGAMLYALITARWPIRTGGVAGAAATSAGCAWPISARTAPRSSRGRSARRRRSRSPRSRCARWSRTRASAPPRRCSTFSSRPRSSTRRPISSRCYGWGSARPRRWPTSPWRIRNCWPRRRNAPSG